MLNFFNLPYHSKDLEGFISSETLSFHYDKHHRAYFDNLIRLILGTDLEHKDLVDIIKLSYNHDNLKAIFNNAAQVFNHDFYWQSLSPKKGQPSEFIKNEIIKYFHSLDGFLSELKKVSLSHFGSGWAWVVFDNSKMKIVSTSNADNPIILNQIPLLCIDVWEHAYYIDYRNKRGDYLDAIIDNLINWEFLEQNLKNIG